MNGTTTTTPTISAVIHFPPFSLLLADRQLVSALPHADCTDWLELGSTTSQTCPWCFPWSICHEPQTRRFLFRCFGSSRREPDPLPEQGSGHAAAVAVDLDPAAERSAAAVNAAACCPTRSRVSQDAWIAACLMAATGASSSSTVGAETAMRPVAKDAVSGGEVGFLLEHVVVLGGLGGVFDLADLRALGLVGDVLDLLLADVASSGIGAHRGADQRERPLDASGQQHRRQEPRIHQRPRPFADPEHRMVSGVGAQPAPGLGDGNWPRSRKRLAELPWRSSVAAMAGRRPSAASPRSALVSATRTARGRRSGARRRGCSSPGAARRRHRVSRRQRS